MILFPDDFRRYHAIIDWNTKNKSFLRIAAVLKRMGIKNYYFMLALTQPELQGIDPHADDLDSITIQKILYECSINYRYYLRECVRVPSAGGDGIPYQLNRANLAASFSYLNDIDYFQVQPRQTGKTMGTQVIMAYHMYILADHVTIGMYTKDSTLVQDNVARLKEIRDTLPWYMITKSTADWDRKEGLSYAARSNFYRTFTAANDERGAIKLGRGSSFGLIHFDEIGFLKYNEIVVSTAIPAMNTAASAARAHGLPAPVIYTTTAGDPGTPEGSFALKIATEGMEFTELLYDCENSQNLKKTVFDHSPRGLLYIEYSYRQLGYTDEWFRYNTARSQASREAILKDFLNVWQNSSERTIIPPELLEKMSRSTKEPTHTDIGDAFVTKYYVNMHELDSELYRDKPLIAGMDTSENVGSDFTVIVIIDPSDMSIVSVSRGNTANIMAVGRYVVNLMSKYEKLVWIPESKSTGVTLINYVIEELQEKNINPYFRIFNMAVQDYGDKKYSTVNLYNYREIYGANKAMFGYHTSAAGSETSRNALYQGTMLKTLEMNYDKIYDKTLIKEFSLLEERNGRVDHPKGMHDDTVISYLLACWLVFFGKHLDMYGLNVDDILAITSTGNSNNSERALQITYNRRSKELESLLNSTDNPTLKACYMREYKAIQSLIDTNVLETTPQAIVQVERERKEILNSKTDINSIRNFFGKRRY